MLDRTRAPLSINFSAELSKEPSLCSSIVRSILLHTLTACLIVRLSRFDSCFTHGTRPGYKFLKSFIRLNLRVQQRRRSSMFGVQTVFLVPAFPSPHLISSFPAAISGPLKYSNNIQLGVRSLSEVRPSGVDPLAKNAFNFKARVRCLRTSLLSFEQIYVN